MNFSKQGKWLVPAIALVALMAMASGGFAQKEDVVQDTGKTFLLNILQGQMSDTEIAVERGTTVIWRNSTGKFIDVNFGMGKQVKQACVAPVGFKLANGGYNAEGIPPGGIASLCFVKTGTFRYTVNVQGGPGGEGTPPPTGLVAVVKKLQYVTPRVSWIDLNWEVVPGQVEAPFVVRGVSPKPKGKK
ncbi:MAG: hypothetical protein ACE5JS_07035 [Nitrospinota bacterium]